MTDYKPFRSKIKKFKRANIAKRDKLKRLYLNYYKNLFMSNFEVEGMTYKQSEFLLSTLWERGTISVVEVQHPTLYEGSEKVAFMNYAPFGNPDIYGYYNKYQVISNYMQPMINYGKVYDLDKDIVIGWATKNHEPIFLLVETLVEQIIEDLTLIDYQRRAHKIPFAITCTPEARDKYIDIINSVLNDDESVIVLDNDDVRNISLMNLSPTYVIDKLRADIQSVDNEIKTLLGLNSIDIEKKERLITSEVNANKEEIESNKNNFIDEITAFLDRANDLFNQSFKISLKQKETINDEEETIDIEKDNEV